MHTGSRPSVDWYFMDMVNLVAQRATCVRRRVGCVIVDSNYHVLSTGYNGVAKGEVHCTEVRCPGADQPTGEGLHLCQAIHAEQNALLQCHARECIHTLYVTSSPCIFCMRLLCNTTVKRIVFRQEYPHVESIGLAQRHGIAWDRYAGSGGPDVEALRAVQQPDRRRS